MPFYQEMKTMNNLARQVYAANHVGELDSFPEEIILLPTMLCNFDCITCTQNHKDKREYPNELFTELETILPFAKFVNINGGEPLLYSKLEELIALISKYETKYWIVTNGSLLNEKWRTIFTDTSLQTIKFSIDGGTAKAYESIRKVGNFKTILSNIYEFSLLKHKKQRYDINLQFNFVALDQNIDSLPRLVTIANNLGVEQINVTYCVCYTKELARHSLFFDQERSDEKMTIAREIGKKLGVNVAIPKLFSDAPSDEGSWLNTNKCDFPFKLLAIDMDGRTNICCGSSARQGNIFTDGFKKTWNAPLWQTIRQTVNTDNENEICKNCTLCKRKPSEVSAHIPDQKIAQEIMAGFTKVAI